MAEEIKKAHLLAHPDYSYQPRKSTERKRRMTQKKAATLSKLSQPMFNESFQPPVPEFSGDMDPNTSIVVNPNTSIVTYEMSTEEPKDMIDPYPDLELTENGDPVVILGDMNLSDCDLAHLLDT